MTAVTRRARPRFTLARYSAQVDAFLSRREESEYLQQAGLETSMGLSALYDENARLFDPDTIDWLQGLVDGDGRDAGQARELLAFATREHVAASVAELTDRIAAAEASAVIMWRGEAIPYRSAWNRATDMAYRGERNGLAASYLEALDAINPMRQERHERMAAAVRALGYASLPGMVRATAGVDPQQLAVQQRAFLAESETVYYASLRRHLAEMDIEQGDAARVDLDRVLRGAGWDRWFPARGMLPSLRRTLAGIGIDLDRQSAIHLDLEHRDRKAPRAFCVQVGIPDDIRLVIQPRGGWLDYMSLLHEAGHAEHFAHVDAGLPVAYRRLGDDSLLEGYAIALDMLVGDPAWLREMVGMPESDAAAFADFYAFWELAALRRLAASLLFELRLHEGADAALARELYAGQLGLTLGVREPPERYLASTDDNLYVTGYVRAAMLAERLTDWLTSLSGGPWWRSVAAGEDLQRSWSRGQEWNAEDVVAHLGYDRLDWRPVLRRIRTRLIGEMSGYGGPNITTRAGTRKV